MIQIFTRPEYFAERFEMDSAALENWEVIHRNGVAYISEEITYRGEILKYQYDNTGRVIYFECDTGDMMYFCDITYSEISYGVFSVMYKYSNGNTMLLDYDDHKRVIRKVITTIHPFTENVWVYIYHEDGTCSKVSKDE